MLNKVWTQDIQLETEPNQGEEAMVFTEESSKRRVNEHIDGILKFNKLYTFTWSITLLLCVSMDTRKCYVTRHF